MRTLFFTGILFTILSVKGISQTIDADTTHTDYIEFGTGGGFTGAAKSYLLTATGKLYKIEAVSIVDSKASFIKQIKTCKAKKIYRYITKHSMTMMVYNEPGNMYSFIYMQLNKRSTTLTWNDNNTDTPATIRKLSEMLHKIL